MLWMLPRHWWATLKVPVVSKSWQLHQASARIWNANENRWWYRVMNNACGHFYLPTTHNLRQLDRLQILRDLNCSAIALLLPQHLRLQASPIFILFRCMKFLGTKCSLFDFRCSAPEDIVLAALATPQALYSATGNVNLWALYTLSIGPIFCSNQCLSPPKIFIGLKMAQITFPQKRVSRNCHGKCRL